MQFKIYPRERISKRTERPLTYYMVRFKKLNGDWSSKDIPINIQSEQDANDWVANNLPSIINQSAQPTFTQSATTIKILYPKWKEYCISSRTNKKNELLDKATITKFFTTFSKYILNEPIASIDLNKIKPADCVNWLENLKRQKVRGNRTIARNTIRDHTQSFRSFFHDARKKGWIDLPSNPFSDEIVRDEIPASETIAGKKVVIYLTKDEFTKLIQSESESIPLNRKVLNLVAIATGCRAAELYGLRWSDIKLTDPIPHIVIARQLSRSNKSQALLFKAPKKGSERVLPLQPITIKVLTYWKENGWLAYVGTKPTDVDAVFPTYTGKFYHFDSAELFRQDLQAAGLPALFNGKHAFTFHALRRTFATQLRIAKADSEARTVLMGHSGKTVAERCYEHNDLSWLQDAALKLPLPDSVAWIK